MVPIQSPTIDQDKMPSPASRCQAATNVDSILNDRKKKLRTQVPPEN